MLGQVIREKIKKDGLGSASLQTVGVSDWRWKVMQYLGIGPMPTC